MSRIPLIEDLTVGPVPPGSNLLVEYDPSSQWYAAASYIAAGWLRDGGAVEYYANAQLSDNVRMQLARLGHKAEDLESTNRLRIYDGYSASVGQKSKERYSFDSLKVADLSLWVSKERMRLPEMPDTLRVVDTISHLARFNEEKFWVEFVLTRMVPQSQKIKSTAIRGIIREAHSDWVYKQLEAVHDGILDFKLEEAEQEPRNLMRIRLMRTLGFDGRWHPVRIGAGFEVTLEK